MLLAAIIVELFSRKRTLAAALVITAACCAALIITPAQVCTMQLHFALRRHSDVTPCLNNPLPCAGIAVVQQGWRHGCLFCFVHLHPRGEVLLVWRPCKPDDNRFHSGFTLEHPFSS